MVHVLLFPSVLGARQGVTDLADALTGAGHEVTTVDPYDGRTFDDYPSGMARAKEIGEEALQARGLEAAKGVGAPFVAVGFSVGATIDEQLQGDVERAGGEFAYVEYQGEGHLFSDPSFGEYQPEEARIFTRRVVELVDTVDSAG